MALASVAFVSCDKTKDPDLPTTEINVTLPPNVDVVKGEPCTIEAPNSGVNTSDRVLLEKDGKLTYCNITAADDKGFSFALPESFVDGTYKVFIKTSERKVPIGTMTIKLVKHKIDIKPETTVYGIVEADGAPLAGVVVSDGVIVTTTDKNGEYQMASAKEHGFVFISVPSGYECELNGVFPDHYRALNGGKLPENHSFNLKKVDQTNYKVLFMGDIHAANRSSNNDLGQFKTVCNDIQSYVNSHASERIYAITLGDMTWDAYWYDQKFAPIDYKNTINQNLSKLPIFHTIGNHDNDMMATGNLPAKSPFTATIAPPYYSFNLGGVHYIVLDDVDCSKYDSSKYIGEANRDNQVAGHLYDPQYSWLALDLQHVSKSTPVCVMMHVPVFEQYGVGSYGVYNGAINDAQRLMGALDGYTVHFVTGHTHRIHNVVPENTAATGGRNVYEHNPAAICADWWWSGRYTPGLLQSSDGTPSGYAVWSISGKDIKWTYKCAGKDENFQFRSYDMNNIKFSLSDVPKLTDANMQNYFKRMIADYTGEQKNEVLLNVWNYNTRWKVEVKTAAGQTLDVRQVGAYDPVQIMAQSLIRMNNSTITSTPVGTPSQRYHFFKVTAPDADTDLVITVTDDFGRTYTENMERPKKFDVDTYRITLK